jgi:hypothetical protein
MNLYIFSKDAGVVGLIVKWGIFKKIDKSNAKNAAAINYKMGSIYWIGQLELNEYYHHANWVKQNIRLSR